MADVIQDVVIRIALQQVEAQLKAPNIQPAAVELKKIEAASAQATQNLQKTYKELEESHKQATGGLSDLATQQRDAADGSRDLSNVQLQVTNQLKESARGALQLARGIAFLSASSDEDFQQMVRTIAKFEGAFLVFRGGINLVEGLTKAHKAYTEAVKAGASANAIFAASLGGAGAGAALLGLGFGIFEIVRQFQRYNEEAKKAEEATKRFTEAATRSELNRGLSRSLIQMSGGQVQMTAGRESFEQQLDEFRTIQEQIERLSDHSAFRAAIQEIELFRQTADERRLTEEVTTQLLEDQASVLEEQASRNERLVDLKRQQRDLTLSELEAKRQELEIEQNRLRTVEEIIGRLSEGDIQQLQELEKRAKEGAITSEEVKRLEGLLGAAARPFASEFFRDIGRDRGGAGLFETLVGGGGDSEQIQQEIDAIQRRSEQAREEFERFFEEIRKQFETLVNAIFELRTRLAGLDRENRAAGIE